MHRSALIFILLLTGNRSHLEIQHSRTAESLRGVSVVSRHIAWASGTHGTFLRTTNGGATWIPSQVPGAETIDFRAVTAFSEKDAYLMSAGPGRQSRIYHTLDAGQHWQLQFTNTEPKGFFDSMAFWDRTHGVVLGDPIPDRSGTLKFEVLLTDDGQNWRPVKSAQLPNSLEGEGAFAASNRCIAIVPRENSGTKSDRPALDPNIWFATGGSAARVFHSPDRGQSWEVFETPIVHGRDSTGIFAITFRDALHGVIAGGDYKEPNHDGSNLAFSEDGGKTWNLSAVHPQAYFSSAAYDKATKRWFVAAQDFVLAFESSRNPQRFAPAGSTDAKFNAIATFPDGGALVVGPKGTVAAIH
ncbi:MAG TPA: hypothetical protein VKV39_08440 [Candidatus Sulfotelmatobacter sp.]|nr:hypothetical protein [Candidatus Sulfotelmatobacter sp.]